MKKLVFNLLLIFSICLNAQSVPVIKISKVKLQLNNSLNSVKDIVSNLNSCEIASFKVTFSTRGAIKEFRVKTEFFTAEIRQIISSFNAGQKFFIEDVKSNCPDKKNYTIIVN